ncbi:M4 family metallopeptidase [Pyxidicoccus parkwayensis]|uniref:Neutral metalloproteinase n=1 Tax=Pyxidicoccus parkwayensis TaxID=2813578 RepID=A0ABX7NL17_9BACT|nr:M4 family metallopeptidase [Pyxidicoccus parkwaysis]QSQ19131.1 M4 family metallopeptidase [Pyxidicoccus parkwaysis]
MAALFFCACQDESRAFDEGAVSAAQDPVETVGTVQAALAALPNAQVMGWGAGGVPDFIRGDLGRVDLRAGLAFSTNPSVRAGLERIAPVFRLTAADLLSVSNDTDHLGSQHLRYVQTKNGLRVVGGDLILHLDANGIIYAANGTARDGFALPPKPTLTAAAAVSSARRASADLSGLESGDAQLVYLLARDTMYLAYEVEVRGTRGAEPARDLVYINARDGRLLERDPQVHSARNRELHDLNHAAPRLPISDPGPLVRAEGQPTTGDATVNANYDRLGETWNCYKTLFNRDSFDNAGAKLISSVHYGSGYNNAAWDGNQMFYGDGDGVLFGNFAASLDVTAHELTHAVTSRTANLIYWGEPGGLNESMSDVLGNACEAFSYGVSANTWKVGEDIYTPGTAGDALRYMNDPKLDNASRDYYFDFNIFDDVHNSSGIGNLAFFLASQGGTHPRGRTTITVPAIGIAKTQQIWYRALTLYMTSRTGFVGTRRAIVNAAMDLYGAGGAEVAAVKKAWAAVGVEDNYIDNADYFVRQLYVDILEREPDQGGFTNAVNGLKSCNGNPSCEAAVRINLARSIFESPENRTQNPELDPSSPNYKAAYLTQCYTTFLRRQPDAEGYAWWLNVLNSTGDYGGVISGFINSTDYRDRFKHSVWGWDGELP